MWDAGRQVLKRRYRDGDAAIDGYAEDYASLIFGLIELFQASGDPHWLTWARALQSRQDEQFWDSQNGGWFNTTGADPSVILRMKEDYDGAEPSPSSVSVLNLLMLAHLTGEPEPLRADRQDAEDVRPAHRPGRACRADDDGCSLHLPCEGGADRRRRTTWRLSDPRRSCTSWQRNTIRLPSSCRWSLVTARQSSLACCHSSVPWRCVPDARQHTYVATSPAPIRPRMRLDSPNGCLVQFDPSNGTSSGRVASRDRLR